VHHVPPSQTEAAEAADELAIGKMHAIQVNRILLRFIRWIEKSSLVAQATGTASILSTDRVACQSFAHAKNRYALASAASHLRVRFRTSCAHLGADHASFYAGSA
jgi:hypothetical protein